MPTSMLVCLNFVLRGNSGQMAVARTITSREVQRYPRALILFDRGVLIQFQLLKVNSKLYLPSEFEYYSKCVRMKFAK